MILGYLRYPPSFRLRTNFLRKELLSINVVIHHSNCHLVSDGSIHQDSQVNCSGRFWKLTLKCDYSGAGCQGEAAHNFDWSGERLATHVILLLSASKGMMSATWSWIVVAATSVATTGSHGVRIQRFSETHG